MYLERIEISGFKSFADKTVIEFDRGMTAIVGPNGSGKSNFSEAIRWVLGEQSAKSLRGNRMEDIIFNGTQARKPVNIARVSLMLNNEDRYLDLDFKQISIERTYHRNGESQFFINKEPVRLKDIVDLLLDSGLGKNSFSIISQGQVEQIFLSKPEERRTIFEEAAGVQKYQYRKQEAERKLHKTADNLSRVRDIIYEIDSQLKPLAKQKDAALIYQEKQAQLKEMEVTYYTSQIQLDQGRWQQATKDHQGVSQAIDHYHEQQVQLQQELTDQQAAQEGLLVQIDQDSEAYQEATRQLEQIKGRLQVIQQQRQYAESSKSNQTLTQKEQAAKLQQLQEQEVQEQAQLTAEEAQLQSLESERQELQKQIDQLTADSGQVAETLRDQIIDLYQEEARSNNQVTQLTQQIDRDQEELKRTERLVEDYEQKLTESQQKLDQLTELESQKAQELQQVQGQLEKQQAEYHQASQVQESLKPKLFQAERDLQQKISQVENQRRLQEDYTGFYAGVRAVMTHADQLAGIEGTVADLIQVEHRYQMAIDIALGGSLQNIVVADDRAAHRAIDYLKRQRAGRASFLPLTNIKGRQLYDPLVNLARQAPGFVGVASDLIHCDARYQVVIDHLAGSTVVIETLSQAQQLSRQAQQKLRLVTLDGELIQPGGAVTGGRAKHQQQSMLQRKNDLERALAQQKQAQILLNDLELSWRESTVHCDQLAQELELTKQQLTELTHTHQRFNADQKQLTDQVESYVKDLQYQRSLSQRLTDDLTKNRTLRDQHVEQSQVSRDQIHAQKERLDQLNLSESEKQTQLESCQAQLNKLQTDLAVQAVELRQGRQHLQQTLELIDQLKQAISQAATDEAALVNNLDQLQAEEENLQDRLAAQEDLSQNLADQLNQARQRRGELTSVVRQLEQDQTALNQELQAHYRKEAKLQAEIDKYSAMIDDQLNYLNQTYSLSFEAASQDFDFLSPSELKKLWPQVKQLRRSIDQLGPVNLQSIEAFEELNTRFQHLTEQENELITAMEQLQETMDEMDDEVIRRFGVTFEQIAKQFEKTFKHLFAGGQASLELTDPEDLLTTGVDIMAQPPGKRKQNLALLSGGERALTAIALLFAILEVKPAPFVILDEVEAALDDANVYRYGEYLKNFTQQTQFIVITHRKGTMEHADMLYGVTMQESGVSKLASVRLTEAAATLDE